MSVNVASVTKLPLVPGKTIKVSFEDGRDNNMKVDPDPDGLEFVGPYMADLTTDGVVCMDTVPNPSVLDTHIDDEVEDADKGNLASEIVDPDTSMPPAQADVDDNTQELTGVV